MKTYCSQNGCEIIYSSARPNFCPTCGFQLGGSRPPVRASAAPQYQPRYEDEEEYSAPDLDPDSLEVSIAGAPRPILFEDVYGSNVKDNSPIPRRKAMSKKDFNAFRERVTSTRRLDVDGGQDD